MWTYRHGTFWEFGGRDNIAKINLDFSGLSDTGTLGVHLAMIIFIHAYSIMPIDLPKIFSPLAGVTCPWRMLVWICNKPKEIGLTDERYGATDGRCVCR